MPITIRRTIRFIITNNVIRNGVKTDNEKEAKKQLNYAKRVTFRTKVETQKTHK